MLIGPRLPKEEIFFRNISKKISLLKMRNINEWPDVHLTKNNDISNNL